MASVSLSKSDEATEEDYVLTTPVSPHGDLPPQKVPGVGLPPPDSGDWEEVVLPPPPPGTTNTTRGGR